MNGATSEDVQAINAGPLRLKFQKRGDRFVHRLIWMAENESIEWLASVDTDADCVGPPIQELVTESRGDSDVLLSVGQAGRNHWSGAITVEEEANLIQVENACRVNQASNWLGSVYRLAGECQIVNEIHASRFDRPAPNEDELPTFVLGLGTWQIEIRADSGTIVEFNEPDSIRIRPVVLPKQLPATVVWGYRIRVVE